MCTSVPATEATCNSSTEPTFLSVPLGDHDLDDDGVADFRIFLKDNDDESPNNPALDNDQAIFVVSVCIKYLETPATVMELVKHNGRLGSYQWQSGGQNGTGNYSTAP